jgi:hypothetical protein
MLLVGLLLVLMVGAVATYLAFPGFFTGHRNADLERTSPVSPPNIGGQRPTIASGQATQAGASGTTATGIANTAPSCRGSLLVKGAPPDAEILIRIGQAPLDAARLPVGTRIEFVATAEGYAPKRAVVTQSALWDRGPEGKPRIEIPIELATSKAKPGGVDPWPSAEAGTQVGGKGEPGTVHIISSPRGAEVWLLAGLGTEGRYEPLPCDAATEVLIAGPTTFRKRLKVEAEDVTHAAEGSEPGTHLVTLNVQ